MKPLGETNCLVFQLESGDEVTRYFKLFGRDGWLAADKRILIETKNLQLVSIELYNEFLGTYISKCDFVILILD